MKNPNKNFSKQLIKALKKSKLGKVKSGVFSDNSGQWVSLHVEGKELSFSLCFEGKKIERIGLYAEKVEVVDQTQIWQAFKKIKKQ